MPLSNISQYNLQTEKIRAKINAIDSNLLKLLKLRFEFCHQIGTLKKSFQQPIIQTQRNNEVISNYLNYAKQYGLNRRFVEQLVRLIIDESCKIQKSNSFTDPVSLLP